MGGKREKPPRGRKAGWLTRIPQLIAAVDTAGIDSFDRPCVEELFGLRRRQAITLLHRLGAHVDKGALVVERERLLSFLRGLRTTKEFRVEQARRDHVRQILASLRHEASARAVRFSVPPPPSGGYSVAGLPESVRLGAGELHVGCRGAQDLLEKLFELSKAIAADFERFEAIVGSSDSSGP